MKIKLSPVRMDIQLAATVMDDAIALNGETLDFSPLKDGETIPAEAIQHQFITGDVSRIDGEIHLTLVLPHGPNAPHSTRFPEYFDKYMTVTEGAVEIPAYDEV